MTVDKSAEFVRGVDCMVRAYRIKRLNKTVKPIAIKRGDFAR
jgi:hypothetical protein